MEINLIDTAQLSRAQASAAEVARVARFAQRAGVGDAIGPGGTNRSVAQAQKAAESFEALFIAQMLAPMFETVPTDGLFGGGHAEQIFRSIQVEELGKEIAKKGGFGIASSVMREILLAQEAFDREASDQRAIDREARQ